MTMKVIHRESSIQAEANEKEVRCLKKWYQSWAGQM